MDGGLIVLGVEDDGTVSGVAPEAVERIKSEITSLSNNPQKLDPPYRLTKYDRHALPQLTIVGRWLSTLFTMVIIIGL